MKPRVAALVALVAAVLAPDTSDATQSFRLERIAGENRYATAAAIAADSFPDGSANVVLATAASFADALAGSYLAGRVPGGAPILLTAPDDLPADTRDALDDLGADTVYVLGGTGAIGDGVVGDLGDRTVVRVAGGDRYKTAARVATFTIEGAAPPGELDGDVAVLLASGTGFADALAAGPVAYAKHLPVLLTTVDTLDPSASQAIDALGARRVLIVGGTASVSDGVADGLRARGIEVGRLAGADRYETATAVTEFAVDTLDMTDAAVDLTSGETFPDALAAGPSSGARNRPLILTAAGSLSGAAAAYLGDHVGTLEEGRVFGGTDAVSDSTVTAAETIGRSGRVDDEWELVLSDEDPITEGVSTEAIVLDDGTTLLFVTGSGGMPVFGSPDGVAFTQETAASTPDGVDPAVVRLPDGRWRLYYIVISGQTKTVRSAVSDDALSWTTEAGDRLVFPAQPSGVPEVLVLPDGRVRMYYVAPGSPEEVIDSAISDDGLTFTEEPGHRTTGAYVDPAVIELSDGTFLGLFSTTPGTQQKLYVGTSADGLTWSIRPETVYGITDNALDATMVRIDDDHFRVYFSVSPAGQALSGPWQVHVGMLTHQT